MYFKAKTALSPFQQGGKLPIYMLPPYKFHCVTTVISPLKSLEDDELRACTTHNIGMSALHGVFSDSEGKEFTRA